MSAQKQPQVLIAGGTSFLAPKLASALLAQNCAVTVVDDFEKDLPENLKVLLNSPNFRFEKVEFLKELPVTLGNFTHIYHLIGVDEYFSGAAVTHKDLLNNSIGTESLLKLAKENEAKFILVSTFDVYAGAISQTSLENYFGPTQIDFSHFSHHEAKRFAESLTCAYFQNYDLDCSIGRVANVYGPGMNLSQADVIARLINQAQTADQLIIEGDGLEIIHPTYSDDVIWGLVKIGFSANTKGGIYNLVNSAEVTVLEFAGKVKQVLGQISPDRVLEIKFEDREKRLKFPIPAVELAKTEQDLGWKPKVELEEGLRRTFEFLAKEETRELYQEKVEEVGLSQEAVLKLPKKSFSLPKVSIPSVSIFKFPQTLRLNLTLALFLLVILLLFVPFGQIFYGAAFSIKNFSQAKSAFAVTDFDKAQTKAAQAAQAAKITSSGFKKFKPAFAIVGQSRTYEKFDQNLQGITLALSGFENLAGAAKEASGLAKVSLLGKDGNLDVKISQLDLKFTTAVSDLETARVYLEQSNLEKLPFVSSRLTNAKRELEQNLPNLKKVSKLVKLLPQLLGIEKPKSYLVLFLNNSELRPGGGFAGSYAVFNFEAGKFSPPEVNDIYNLDGQLRIQIPAPAPLKQYLGVENLGLRDSNWHYDFSQNGTTAAALYQQATGKTVDGVVGIDVTAITSLLNILGPVKLADYEEEITAANLAEKAEFYSEVGFFPGSTSKKDFLGAVARQVILKLQEGGRVNYFELAKTLSAVASEKHLNFYFSDENLASFVTDVGWSGKIKPISEQSNGQVKIITDFLALSEANVGANKSNRFVKREIKISPIILRDGDLITSLEINYTNASPAPTWPGGNYKNYLRVVTPVGTKLEQAKIQDADVTAGVEQLTEGDKQIFAVFLEIPAGEARKAVFVYRPNYRIEVGDNGAAYSLLIEKQPGTDKDPVEIDLSYPGYLKAIRSTPQSAFSEQKVNLKSELQQDLNFKIEFTL